MKCPKCGSDQIRRTAREGPKEGILLRLVSRAPFRCQACNWRFISSFPAYKYRRMGPRRTVAAYLGLGPRELKKLRLLLISLATVTVLIVLVVKLLRLLPESQSKSDLQDPDRIHYRR